MRFRNSNSGRIKRMRPPSTAGMGKRLVRPMPMVIRAINCRVKVVLNGLDEPEFAWSRWRAASNMDDGFNQSPPPQRSQPRSNTQTAGTPAAAQRPASSGFDDMDGDIPF